MAKKTEEVAALLTTTTGCSGAHERLLAQDLYCNFIGLCSTIIEAIVTAIELSIVQAHNNLRPGSIFINKVDYLVILITLLVMAMTSSVWAVGLDGPGVFGFQQGDTEINPFWKKLRDVLRKPSPYQEDCQKPKTVLLDTERCFAISLGASNTSDSNYQARKSNTSVPGEFTTMAGRRLREAVKETLISSGNGEFDDQTHVVIAGLTNAYSQYITTSKTKNKDNGAASTLYGPHTLSAYIQEFKKLAESMAKGENINKGLTTRPFLIQLRNTRKGDSAVATFWSANPRYDLLTEGTFAVVEMLQGESWLPAYDDDDFCLFFKWQADNSTGIARAAANSTANVNSYGYATLEWEVPEEANTGVYRF
ncbi:hypothetical protein HAX54_034324 [Datura stramonium]|uniref:Neutral ceramidase n=1 Tax=Datura stramonium TaxID=4076 RepID=A0ABS8SE15_DATST|nr:hypothetical protein [Datura stramonium]